MMARSQARNQWSGVVSSGMTGGRPLSGVRVLDLTRVFAGPVAGRILVDLGAEVVKVEPPEGDITRKWGRRTAGLSSYFTQQNCGKQTIGVDLTAPGGPELVAELAAAADIVIENFRPGVLARYGLDWERLSAQDPGLIMLSISGFGQGGPESQRAAYAAVIHAETGVIDQGAADGPQDVGFGAADVISGMHGVIALLAALRVRDATGMGQYIDIAMVDAMVFSSDQIMTSLDRGPAEVRRGELWDTASGRMMIPGGLRWIWHQMSNLHGLVDPSPEGADLDEKLANRRQTVTDFLCGLPDRDAVIAALDHAGLAWGELRAHGEVFESPTIAHRGTVVEIDDRAGGRREVVRSPYRMSETDTGVVGHAGYLGECNRDVMERWLDKDDPQIDRLVAGGVLVHDERIGAGDGQGP